MIIQGQVGVGEKTLLCHINITMIWQTVSFTGERYAVFYTPTNALAHFGAEWLGWDNAKGAAVPHLDIPDLNVPGPDVEKITRRSRKYGLHGTLKAPFYLAPNNDQTALKNAAVDFASQQTCVEIDPLELRHGNGFVALRPKDDPHLLKELATSNRQSI